MDALSARHSVRELKTDPIAPQVLSNLLWAAWGINRADKGKRTAPSAVNAQEIDIYVIRADGVWLFDAEKHALVLVTAEDIRRTAGYQPFTARAPVNLAYVADFRRFGNVVPSSEREFYAAADTGFIGQNVYLFCASAGLGTVMRGWVDRKALQVRMGLNDDQHVQLVQTVGWPE